jgi:hypothetical protein
MHEIKNLHYYYNQCIVGNLEDDASFEDYHTLILKHKSFFHWSFILECLLLLIFPLPFYDKFIIIYYTDKAEKIED